MEKEEISLRISQLKAERDTLNTEIERLEFQLSYLSDGEYDDPYLLAEDMEDLEEMNYWATP